MRAHMMVVTCAGGVHAGAAMVQSVWALDLLRSWGNEACILVTGPAPRDGGALARLIADLGLEEHVRFCAQSERRDATFGADVAMHLHLGGAGAPLAALADAIAAGLPLVASASLARCMDLPDDTKLVAERHSPILVAEAVLAAHAGGRLAPPNVGSGCADELCAALGLP